MSPRPLRWAVIGTGVVSAAFAQALARVPGNQRHAIVSRELGTAQDFAARHGFAIALALDDSVFQHPDIDAFYIATPTASHRDLCLRAIAAGKPVLCEKPMTASAEQLLEVQHAAAQAGVFAMEGMWLRFNPLIAQLRARLARGECGELVGVSMQIGYAQASLAKADIDPSCDALSVFGCYGLSLALHLFGRPLRVLASGQTRGSQGAVEHAQIILSYAGFSFLLETSIVADTRNALEVLGRSGRLAIAASVIDPYRLDSSAWSASRGRKLWRRVLGLAQVFADHLAPWHALRGSGFRAEVAEFAAGLAAGRLQSAVNPLAATLACHEIDQAARASLACGQWQALPQDAPTRSEPPCPRLSY
jgi:predicted dehydrogenase